MVAAVTATSATALKRQGMVPIKIIVLRDGNGSVGNGSPIPDGSLVNGLDPMVHEIFRTGSSSLTNKYLQYNLCDYSMVMMSLFFNFDVVLTALKS